MKNFKIYFLILIILILGFSVAFLSYILYIQPRSQKVSDLPTKNVKPVLGLIEIKTDKETYSSYEKIEIEVNIEIKDDFKNVKIKITGIKPHRTAYINKTKIVNLEKGRNTFTINARAPSCTSGCGGVYPGPYDISAEIFIEDTLVGSQKTTIKLIES